MAARTAMALYDGVSKPLEDGDTLQDAGGNAITGSAGPKITHKARVVTTANITDLAAGAPNTVDGITLSDGDPVLVTGQSTATQNGLYTVTTAGSGSDGAWARHADMDSNTEINAAVAVGITEGTLYHDSLWLLDHIGGLTIGSSNINFVKENPARRREIFKFPLFLDGQNQLTGATVGKCAVTRGGYLVGSSIAMESARTAGSIAIEPHVNGSGLAATGLDLAINGTETTIDTATVAYGTSGYAVTAGQTIGFLVTTSTYTPLDNTGELVLEFEVTD